MTVNEYFKNDELAANVWLNKYQLKDNDGNPLEETPDDMHKRLAKEFARADAQFPQNVDVPDAGKLALSTYGRSRPPLTEERVYNLIKNFKYIVPQGSIMQMLGNPYKIGSLSNCFVIGQPEDSYAGIMKKDEELVQLMKRRGGVGLDLSTLRPRHTKVNNAALTSSGAASFANRFSNSTREVAQDGRRGALMLTMHINHPDIEEFIDIKLDGTKVTGANVSIPLTDEFMIAVVNDLDFHLRFPVNFHIDIEAQGLEVGGQYSFELDNGRVFGRKVRAKELWEKIISAAHKSAEPGIMFLDTHYNNSPDSVYPKFKGVTTNPCFHPDTLIETVEGRKKIKDITAPTMVYSMDREGKLCIKNASASFISKRNAETLRIHLKSDSFIEVTPDHLLYVHDKGWIKAMDIKLGDRIVHLSRNRRGAKYSGVKLTTQGIRDYVMEHRLVYSAYHNIDINSDINVHHKDGNTFNNTISNLELLSHSDHARHTATFQNPQIHQVRGDRGRFVSGENSKHGTKEIINVPDELKTNLLSRHHNAVIRIEKGETTDVYDIQVEDTHCLVANNMVAHNCGEIFMGAYDACRLIATNFFSFVQNPYTPKASFNFEKFYAVVYEQQVMSDNIVTLELEHINRIIEVANEYRERNLWRNIYDVARAGRRTGSGFTGLGDTLAALGLPYLTTPATLRFIEALMRTKMRAELDANIDMAILRDPFPDWALEKEYIFEEEGDLNSYQGTNLFYVNLKHEFPEQFARMIKYGRRNVSWSTVAPTGTVSILTGTTSGIEPLFSMYYTRRKKINANDRESRVDFIDQLGDKFQEFAVFHPQIKNWLAANNMDIENIQGLATAEIDEILKYSPWYTNTANDIPAESRIAIQSIVQKYTTHSISATVNLPNSVKPEVVADLYMQAWKKGLKGITVYRDGSRSGILLNKEAKDTFSVTHAPKRGKELEANLHFATANKINYTIVVGLKEDKPYEVFAFSDKTRMNKIIKGKSTKVSKGVYSFSAFDQELNKRYYVENMITEMNPEEKATPLYVSMLLRHGTPITHVIKTMKKVSPYISSFTAAMTRVLSYYVPDGTLSAETCKCGSKFTYEDGCKICKSCGESECG